MDWIAALCLSVPIAMGIVIATSVASNALTTAAQLHARCLNESIFIVGKQCATAVEALAEALVTAAKYQSKAIRVKPKIEKPGEVSVYDKWLAAGGLQLPTSVQEQVFWAISRLKGEESDEQGDDETASRILTQWAPGVESVVRAEIMAGR